MPNTLCRIPGKYVFIKLTLHTYLRNVTGTVQALNRLNSFRNEDSKSVLPATVTWFIGRRPHKIQKLSQSVGKFNFEREAKAWSTTTSTRFLCVPWRFFFANIVGYLLLIKLRFQIMSKIWNFRFSDFQISDFRFQVRFRSWSEIWIFISKR